MVLEQNKGIENIDLQNDEQELSKALEGGFFENEENAAAVGNELEEQNRNGILEQESQDFYELSDQEIENINTIEQFGIKLFNEDINYIKDIHFSTNEIKNINEIKELGVKIRYIDIINIYRNKIDIKITDELKDTIKKIQSLNISIRLSDIQDIGDMIIPQEMINNLKMMQEELGVKIGYPDIINIYNNQTDTKLENDDINKIKFFRDLGINLYFNDIQEIRNINLSEDDIRNIEQIQNLGIDIGFLDIFDTYYGIVDINLTQDQINNITEVQKIGFKVDFDDIETIKSMTTSQIENLKKLKSIIREGNCSIEDLNNIDIGELEIFETNFENIYDGYGYNQSEIESHHHYKKGRIIENIEDYVQNAINENRNIGRSELIDQIRSDLITLPISDKLDIINGINKIVTKFNTVRRYIDFEYGPYKTPKELLCAMRGLDQELIDNIADDDITVRQHGTGLQFFVGDPNSYQIIYDRSLTNSGLQSGGFNNPWSAIEGLEGTLSVGNSRDPGENEENFQYGVIWHEGQHNRNTYFMPDKFSELPITRAKDEITAYLRDGRGIFEKEKRNDTIYEILTLPENEGGLYQYGLQGEDREQHKEDVRNLLHYANNLIQLTKDPTTGLTRDNVISMLSDTPVEERENLNNNITQAIENHKNNPNEQIDFRRNGTETMDNLITKLEECQTLENFKHTLNDPRYSHISRQPNSRGGIEISAIIDEVASGNLPITFIPNELKSIVEKFI